VRRTVRRLKTAAARAGDNDTIKILEEVEEKAGSDSIVSYVNLLRRTRIVFVIILLGIGAGLTAVYKNVIQGETDARVVAQKIVPTPVNWIIIEGIDLLTPAESNEVFEYSFCSTAHRPSKEIVYERFEERGDE
jgi:hypothetical protein